MVEIYQETAKASNLDYEIVEKVMETVFAWVRKELIDINTKGVLFNYLGSFQLMEKVMQEAVESGRLSKEDKEKTIKLLNKINNKDEN